MKKRIHVYGGGPAGLTAARFLLLEGFEVHLFEKERRSGKKFLVAGKGGFNLTHSEDISTFASRYFGQEERFTGLLETFSPTMLRAWLMDLGVETYVGSSGRVFPVKGINPAEVLKAMMEELSSLGLVEHYGVSWKDFEKEEAHAVLLAFGGASWPQTGSDAHWVKPFIDKGIRVNPFEASNAGMQLELSPELLNELDGGFIKNMSCSCDDTEVKGEIVFSRYGIEGTPVYALNPFVREKLKAGELAIIHIDLKPVWSLERIEKLLSDSSQNTSQVLKRELKLSPWSLKLLKGILSKEDFLNPEKLAEKIKSLPLEVNSLRPIEEAISSAGGVDWSELDENFMLKKRPGFFLAGEMIDWEAPTGGYLLQGCFSTAHAAAKGIKSYFLSLD